MATPRDPWWNFLGKGSHHWEKTQETKGIQKSNWAKTEIKKQKAEDKKKADAKRIREKRQAEKKKKDK